MAHHFPKHNADSSLPATAGLMKMLETSPDQFQEKLSEIESPAFHEYLYLIMKKQGFSAPSLIADASVSKTYAYQFLNGERIPGRDIILRMCLAMGTKLDETQRLLTLAGKSVLYPKIRRDAGILYCLRKELTLDEANSFLENLGEHPLL